MVETVSPPGRTGGNGGLAGRSWLWRGGALINEYGETVAWVRSDIVAVGDERLLLETLVGMVKFRCRATTSQGYVWHVSEKRFGRSRLVVTMGDRVVEVRRRDLSGNVHVIVAGARPVAEVVAGGDGSYTVRFVDDDADMDVVEVVFVSLMAVYNAGKLLPQGFGGSVLSR